MHILVRAACRKWIRTKRDTDDPNELPNSRKYTYIDPIDPRRDSRALGESDYSNVDKREIESVRVRRGREPAMIKQLI